MSDEPHTDQSGAARELGFLLKTRLKLAECAARDAEDLASDESDAKARKISAIVIALTRITEMEDRYEGRIADRCRNPDDRERALRRLRRDAARLVGLPDAEFDAEYREIRALAAAESETSAGGLSGARTASLEGDRS